MLQKILDALDSARWTVLDALDTAKWAAYDALAAAGGFLKEKCPDLPLILAIIALAASLLK